MKILIFNKNAANLSKHTIKMYIVLQKNYILNKCKEKKLVDPPEKISI